jgi:hypothetical protein
VVVQKIMHCLFFFPTKVISTRIIPLHISENRVKITDIGEETVYNHASSSVFEGDFEK